MSLASIQRHRAVVGLPPWLHWSIRSFAFLLFQHWFRNSVLLRLTLITFPSVVVAEKELMWPGRSASDSKLDDIVCASKHEYTFVTAEFLLILVFCTRINVLK